MDHGANRFGEFLLNVCKAVNMRIVNGRLFDDKAIGKFTCTMHNGESVVDYLLTSHEDFAELWHFSINDFKGIIQTFFICIYYRANSILGTI